MSTSLNIQNSFSDNLCKTYSWFSDVFTSKLQDGCNDFFNLQPKIKMLSISENSGTFFKGDLYFTTQIKVDKNNIITIRLSEETIKAILNETLGQGDKLFKLENLSELEIKILNAFCQYLYSTFKKIINNTQDKNNSICNMVFTLNFNGENIGKVVISTPVGLFTPEAINNENETFTINTFRKSYTEVKIKVGSSKLKLCEIKSLMVDDILLLEQSSIYRMRICLDKEEVEFKISPDPRLILDDDEDEGEEMSGNTPSMKNLWDSIQVDINAEFEKVKISLGELKQISEGLVVDIGSIYESKIDLKVENKTVAKGELVIINDRYGVRIDEVVEEQEEEIPNLEQQSQEYQGGEHQETIQNNNQEYQEEYQTNNDEFEDDDFNYDDFDDESI